MGYLVFGIIIVLAVLVDLWLMRGWNRWLQSRDLQDVGPKFFL